MKVEDVMTTKVETCSPQDPLSKAAAIMWQHDCGCVPVVDRKRKVVGMLTDRDICMATWSKGKPVQDLTVSLPMSRDVWTCKASDPLAVAERTMREKRVRRLPVVDAQGRLQGVLSLNDIVRRAESPQTGKASPGVSEADVCRILADVSTPRPATSSKDREGPRRG